ncbi:ubiquitin-conjugating enzyme E2 S [Xylographa soralifera]|nr:ubiquitin-conjugating enzyme E2 S [Xylographa soralifera]
MNSSTLRRLAADHASLHKSELPPYYLFQAGAASMPDDLTQLSILLTGPQGTPYAAGVWKLHLKIPHDYPKSAPKASFRTKMWHPNVEESTGSVCVETLKRDWQPKLTLRDILMTISCLLIQPNPDSALNASAGKLLQEDYEAFSRQAKLMTSIHAPIPTSLQAAVAAAKSRGEETKPVTAKQTSRKRPHLALEDPIIPHQTVPDHDTDPSDDEATASKENDPALSPSPVNPPMPSSRRPQLLKRPLSDLPTPTETDSDDEDEVCAGLTSSERNIAANTPNLSSNIARMAVSEQSITGTKLVERSRSFNFAARDRDESITGGLMIMPFEDQSAGADAEEEQEENYQPPTKRVCSGEEKENITEAQQAKPILPAKLAAIAGPTAKVAAAGSLRKVSSASGSSGGAASVRVMAKPRVGLRRL